jgi:four helix bundle protein
MKDEGYRNLRERTTAYALRVMTVCDSLPRTRSGKLRHPDTSFGPQYREAFRARSKAESISKIESSLQELEESSYWLEIIARRKMLNPRRLVPLLKEAGELTAILVTCVKKMKEK